MSTDPDDDLRPFCPVCHRRIRLRKDGTLWTHAHGRRWSIDGQRFPDCPGSWKEPA